ncbi:MAG TPA: PQQ-binding-like beta-propeller repeat protein [Planctomycetota bacterium]|nr:PQQ-binding-like beta-propeller repeat protein [Planctomycetota bacterium]
MKKAALLLAFLASCSQDPAPTAAPLKPDLVAYAPEQVTSKAGPFVTREGRKGWTLPIPGGRPLAGPAYADGRLFLGGGFGSTEFYCVDADSGKILWEFKTGDDGPTAAVIEGRYVVFNTESCTIYTLEISTGKQVWSKWLGDPLLSQPAIADGRVYMAYPGKDGSHHLVCMAIEDGKELWDGPIEGDIIAAPVVHAGSVYLTTLDGTLYRYGAADGKLAWSEKRDATSAPWVYKDQVLVSQGAGEELGRKIETLALTRSSGSGAPLAGATFALEGSRRPADYLDSSKQGGTGGLALTATPPASTETLKESQNKADAGVGFAVAPLEAKLYAAELNLGVMTVCGAWAYQGSRPSVAGGRSYSAMGDVLLCHDLKTGKFAWQKSLKPPRPVEGLRLLAPPALANNRVFLSTALGDVLCMDAMGSLLWSVNVGEPIVFQPTVMKGRIYVGTSGGHLVAIETGDAKDDGWPMWGGSAAHNGPK